MKMFETRSFTYVYSEPLTLTLNLIVRDNTMFFNFLPLQ
jgi:hypothetical protein